MAFLPRSARLLRVLFLAGSVLPLVQACGRSELDDYVYESDGTISKGASANNSAGRGSGTAGRGSGTAGRGSGVGGFSPVAGTPGTGATGMGFGGTAVTVGGGGPIPQGGTIGVAGSVGTAGNLGMAGFGVAGSPQVTPVTCGDQSCDPKTQICCAGLAGLQCVGSNQDCGGAVLGCTLNEDCAGNGICCISITGDASAASSCKATCDTGGGTRDRQLCQTADECVAPFRYCTATIFGVNICTRRP